MVLVGRDADALYEFLNNHDYNSQKLIELDEEWTLTKSYSNYVGLARNTDGGGGDIEDLISADLTDIVGLVNIYKEQVPERFDARWCFNALFFKTSAVDDVEVLVENTSVEQIALEYSNMISKIEYLVKFGDIEWLKELLDILVGINDNNMRAAVRDRFNVGILSKIFLGAGPLEVFQYGDKSIKVGIITLLGKLKDIFAYCYEIYDKHTPQAKRKEGYSGGRITAIVGIYIAKAVGEALKADQLTSDEVNAIFVTLLAEYIMPINIVETRFQACAFCDMLLMPWSLLADEQYSDKKFKRPVLVDHTSEDVGNSMPTALCAWIDVMYRAFTENNRWRPHFSAKNIFREIKCPAIEEDNTSADAEAQHMKIVMAEEGWRLLNYRKWFKGCGGFLRKTYNSMVNGFSTANDNEFFTSDVNENWFENWVVPSTAENGFGLIDLGPAPKEETVAPEQEGIKSKMVPKKVKIEDPELAEIKLRTDALKRKRNIFFKD